MTSPASDPSQASRHPRAVIVLLNVAHAVDHMFLLIFATAVVAIAADFGQASWQDLMPYTIGAFVLFGLGSLPAGRLGDLWGRRAMMLVFFFGMGASALLTALTQNAWQLAAALTVLGAFSSIYHPVGIPMLVQHADKPGFAIGVNGLVGNLGIAFAALITGFLVKWIGWRAAFVVPGLFAIACGVAFAILCPPEHMAPAKRKGGKAQVQLTPAMLVRTLTVMTVAAAISTLVFNFTTNGNSQLMAERFRGLVEDPAALGTLLAAVYAVASLTQVAVGYLIDRMPFKALQFWISLALVPVLVLAAFTQQWWFYAALLLVMVFVFGSIPFTDAMIVRYVDDGMRSRIAGLRLTVAFGMSSFAVWMLGPVVKQIGFEQALWLMAAVAAAKAGIVLLLPDERTAMQPAHA
ncbi:MAG TPA: MFS transporter [Ramlibacter sp.]|uniref:MFS transporter n=1 Tax=Ramlibacter sp. TaxID=1917967 RepID=UPI002D7FC887|nr:MFS transporter [Ramlibacter sp.]HET8747709.1 MFS transporter [Ramlibacter sp.]